MKIKNANLEWYVMYSDFGNKDIKRVNILGYDFAEIVAKEIKKKKITNRETLKEFLKREFMYHYWSKSEYEIAVGGLFAKYPDDFEKLDVWFQLEKNLDTITDYIIYKMNINFKEDVGE